jgi:hypothetical protein
MHDPIDLPATTGRRHSRLGLAAVALGTATIVMALVVPFGAADDRFTAGGRVTTPLRATAAELQPALDRAATIGRAIGLPDGRLAAARIHDAFAGLDLDEVVTFDGSERPIAIQRFDRDGGLVMAVRLGWSRGGISIPEAGALPRAQAVARAAGLRPEGSPRIETDRTGDGWVARWSRLVDGIPVIGDGVTVRLWSDGSVHSISATASELAERPAALIDEREAAVRAQAIAAGWGASGAGAELDGLRLAWVAPNDLFDPSGPDAPGAQLRLSWVANVRPFGELASRVRAVQLFIDAGDGRLTGGDVLE